jgi:hypothetical protein
VLRVHCSGGIANAEALSMLMIFDGYSTILKESLRNRRRCWMFSVVDDRTYSSFIDSLFHAFGNQLLAFELRATKGCINERSNNNVNTHIAVTET